MTTERRECRYCGRKFIPKGTEHYCSATHKRLRQRDYQRERRASEPKVVRAYQRDWVAKRRRDKAFREAERARQRQRYARSHHREDCHHER